MGIGLRVLGKQPVQDARTLERRRRMMVEEVEKSYILLEVSSEHDGRPPHMC
jgi:hypothetical protein